MGQSYYEQLKVIIVRGYDWKIVQYLQYVFSPTNISDSIVQDTRSHFYL